MHCHPWFDAFGTICGIGLVTTRNKNRSKTSSEALRIGSERCSAWEAALESLAVVWREKGDIPVQFHFKGHQHESLVNSKKEDVLIDKVEIRGFMTSGKKGASTAQSFALGTKN
eukprot:scaffold1022_cov196-Alexandrium_tamarense.AAC.5